MDKLQRSGWLAHLSGQVFLTHHLAIEALAHPTPAQSAKSPD
jgi:hypothetical protein